jgi:hypothetical protein
MESELARGYQPMHSGIKEARDAESPNNARGQAGLGEKEERAPEAALVVLLCTRRSRRETDSERSPTRQDSH